MHLEIYGKTGAWRVRKWLAKQALTSLEFDSIEMAEKWIRETYQGEDPWDRPWVDHVINGSRGHLMKIEHWKLSCEDGGFIDYDGFGDLVKDEQLMGIFRRPSDVTHNGRPIPEDATHILWYNR